MPIPTNQKIAGMLRQVADLLDQQGANPFRISAYRRAADTIDNLERDVRDIVEEQGADGLLALPNIGQGIASAILEIITTGTWNQLERLRGSLDPVQLFCTIPGIGPELAQRIHDTLQIDSLEALEIAAHNGRLQSVPGMGRRRVAALRATLDTMLGRLGSRRFHGREVPGVDLLLEVDREYREKVEAGRLRTIAPRRFNPEGKSWLPVLHARRGRWYFTVLYSNTARAHELGRVHDWVVAYFYDDLHQEGQHTIVTETRGLLAGKRVVRGREPECRTYYAQEDATLSNESEQPLHTESAGLDKG